MPTRSSKRILYVEPVGEKGGAEVVLLDILRNLDRERFAPVVACLQPGPLVRAIEALGVKAYALGPFRTRQFHKAQQAVSRLAGIIREERIDLIHANTNPSLLYSWLAGGRGRLPIVWHLYDPASHSDWHDRFFHATQRLITPAWTIFASTDSQSTFLAEYPRLKHHSLILPGVDTTETAADPLRGRQALGIPEHAPVVAMFARLQEHKGQLRLVEAAPAVLAEVPETRFLLCGANLFGLDPGYGEQVERRISELGLQDRVLLTGYLSEELRTDVLMGADVVVHPADYEPFGLNVLEAMAAGKPVVATDSPGPSTLVDPGVTGVLVRRGDSQAIATALINLLRDPHLARRMGLAGRERAASRFDLRHMIGAIEAIYEELEQRGRGR